MPYGNFQFLALPFSEHTGCWVLQEKVIRDWFKQVQSAEKVGHNLGQPRSKKIGI